MKVDTLNRHEFSEHCLKLQDMIVSSGFNPEKIISIAKGGDYVAREFTLENVEFLSIKLQRKSTSKKDHAFILFLLKFLPYWMLNGLRIIESILAEFYSKDRSWSATELATIRSQLSDFNLETTSRILILDDAIDTGNTLHVIYDCVASVACSGADIRTAAIVTTMKSSKIEPNYRIRSGVLLRFPWSKDYKQSGTKAYS